MQRIQSWFDQLTIGRQSRRTSRRRRNLSRTAADDDRRRKCSPPATRAMSHSAAVRKPRDELKPLPVRIAFPPPPTSNPPMPHHHTSSMMNLNLNGSFPRRNRIRTNPWVGENKMWDSMTTSSMGRSMESSQRNAPSFCVASPDTSMCSSGYASNDSSPDTSMVWSNSGEWKNYDNGNIYHELMMGSNKLSESSYSINGNTHMSFLPTPSPKHERSNSPIYAEPWTQYHNHLPTSHLNLNNNHIPMSMTVRNNCYRPASPIYAQPYSERLSPQKQQLSYLKEMTDDELARDEFLHELDQQIHELQMRSEELREMVDRARMQRKEFMIPKMECKFELVI